MSLTEALNAAPIRQAGFGHGAIEDALAGASAHGLQRFVARKEEAFGAGFEIVLPEHAQQVIAQESVALTSAFGMGDQQTMASAVQVGDLNMGGFGQT